VSNGTSASDDNDSDKQWQRWSAILSVAAGLIALLTFFGITNFDQLKHLFGSTVSPAQSISASSNDSGPAPTVGSTTPAPIPSATSPAPLPTTPIEIIPSPSPLSVLTFTPPDGAYDAQAGDCIFGVAGAGQQWNTVTCADGNFTVLAVDTGTANSSVCSSGWGASHRDYTFADSGYDEVLCLRFNYYSIMGYATVNECFAVSGPSNDLTFSYTSSCVVGDIVVVAHYGIDESSDCNRYNGYATGDPPGFPGLAWTVCFNNVN
jgi:hypothetical protein